MKFKKVLSAALSAVLAATSLFCFNAAAADSAEETVVYSYLVTTEQKIAAFDGVITYPSNLSVTEKDVAVYTGETKNEAIVNADTEGAIKFNASLHKNNYDFNDGKALVTVTFTVNDEYDASDINTTLSEFYSVNSKALSQNISYRYEQQLDGATYDNGENTWSNTGEHVYIVNYNYLSSDDKENTRSVVKTTTETNPQTIAEENMPAFKAPDYTYSIGGVTLGDDYVITVDMTRGDKTYPVYVEDENGKNTKLGDYKYLEKATVTADENSVFMLNGHATAYGQSFTFYVGGQSQVTVIPGDEEFTEDYATIDFPGHIVEDGKITMQFLATAKIDNFKRLGVAFSNHELSADDIKADALEVTDIAQSKRGSKGCVIYNSQATKPNASGQYQFIFAPYMNVTAGNKDMTLYFYNFAVSSDNEVTICEEAQTVSFADILA